MKRLSSILVTFLFGALSTPALAFFQSAGYYPQSRTATAFFGSSGPSESQLDPSEIIARRLVVTGDVQGGYFRACVLNEARRFRKLVGTMTPPDDSEVAEIYIEGKRKMVDGFIRWCQKGSQKIGLSQTITVKEVIEEQPTGLYDDFYAKTH